VDEGAVGGTGFEAEVDESVEGGLEEYL